jgi:hypothetical protein
MQKGRVHADIVVATAFKKKGFFLVDVAHRTTCFIVITWNDRLLLISSSHSRLSLIAGFIGHFK